MREPDLTRLQDNHLLQVFHQTMDDIPLSTHVISKNLLGRVEIPLEEEIRTNIWSSRVYIAGVLLGITPRKEIK